MNYLPKIILANLFLILIWISYELFLSKTRIFQANRFFLLGGSLLAAILPWLPWQIRFTTNADSFLGMPLLPAATAMSEAALPTGATLPMTDPGQSNWFATAYFVIVGILLIFSAGQLIRLLIWSKTKSVHRWNNHRIIVFNKPWSAFSFFRTIYYPEPFNPDSRQTQTILAHEKVHARQLHSLDNLIILAIRILFFFNPVVYLISGKLRLTHEFIADEVTAGYDKADYSQTLISHQFMVPRLILMHSFNSKSFLKRRLTMLSKNKQHPLAGWKYLMLLPLIGGMILLSGWSASAQNQAKKSKEEIAKMAVEKELSKAGYSKADIEEIQLRIDGVSKAGEVRVKTAPPPPKPGKVTKPEGDEKQVFLIVENMPEFNGGNIDTFRSWVMTNVKYPKEALAKKISGTVHVSFIVDPDGKVTDIKITRSVDPSLDEAVMSCIRSSPDWKPGTQRGEAVNVSFSIPVKFNVN